MRKLNPIAKPYSGNDKSMDSSPRKRASGTMSGLSTLKDLEELSISCQSAALVSRSVLPAVKDKIKMREICSRNHSGSLVSVDPESWSLSKCPESYQLGLENTARTSKEFYVSLPRSGTLTLDGKSFRLRTLELPISGNDGSASPNWPTPRVSDTEGGLVHNVELKNGSFSRTNKQGVRWGVKLRDATENWATPTTQEIEHPDFATNLTETGRRKPKKGKTSHSLGLADQSVWMTPNTMDTLDPKSQKALDRESSTVRKGRSQPNNLRDQVAVRDGDRNWPTPRSIDHKNPDQPVDRRENTPPQHLSAATKNWPTPTKRDWKGSGPSVERKDGKSRMSHLDYKAELSHFGQTTDPDSLSSPHHQMTTSHGSGLQNTDQIYSRQLQKRLNSKFVEYLMGLPENWTSLKPIGPNA